MNTRVSPLTMACPDCDLLQRVPTLEPGTRVGCVRCGRLLMKRSSGPPDLALALTLAATIAYVVANTLPLMDLRSVLGIAGHGEGLLWGPVVRRVRDASANDPATAPH